MVILLEKKMILHRLESCYRMFGDEEKHTQWVNAKTISGTREANYEHI